ncbi:MAG TPA: DUF2635 domain-containing protein [Kofleriaceae bacterium]|nr:DUF2635 domain-containing protein [Kofleriaceae bacterium]
MKPAIPGAVIPDPITRRPLPDEGGDVPETQFWVRRWLAGEVVRIDDESGAAPRTTREK